MERSSLSRSFLLASVLFLLFTVCLAILGMCGLLLRDCLDAYRSPAGPPPAVIMPPRPSLLQTFNFSRILAEIGAPYGEAAVRSTRRRLSEINCRLAPQLRLHDPVGSGWTKTVFRGELDGRPVAVKTVSPGGHDVTQCRATGVPSSECFRRSARKFVREVWHLLHFRHPNVVRMLGVCLPSSVATSPVGSPSPRHILASVVELGENVDLIRLLQMSWDERLRVFRDLTDLLAFLSHTPLGSMVLDDFRRQQFVLVNGRLKLTDLDDLHTHRRPCRHHSQCLVAGQTMAESRPRCLSGACFQWSERMNLHRAYVQFGSFLLSHGHPELLAPHIAKYKERFSAGRVSVPWLRSVTEGLVEAYRLGKHLNRTHGPMPPAAFKTVINMDASTADGLWCVQHHGCRLTVFDMAEAERICAEDHACIGFVDSGERSWLNHSIVYLKTKQSRLISKAGHTLYLRPT